VTVRGAQEPIGVCYMVKKEMISISIAIIDHPKKYWLSYVLACQRLWFVAANPFRTKDIQQ